MRAIATESAGAGAGVWLCNERMRHDNHLCGRRALGAGMVLTLGVHGGRGGRAGLSVVVPIALKNVSWGVA